MFFNGVCNVVQRLLSVVKPTHAFFGDKDLQQRIIIEQMVKDLNLNISIINGKIIRDKNGLALSSRNLNLSKEDYQQALILPKTLNWIKQQVNEKPRQASVLKKQAEQMMENNTISIEYIAFMDLNKYKLTNKTITKQHHCFIAICCKKIRLIDNKSMKNNR